MLKMLRVVPGAISGSVGIGKISLVYQKLIFYSEMLASLKISEFCVKEILENVFVGKQKFREDSRQNGGIGQCLKPSWL